MPGIFDDFEFEQADIDLAMEELEKDVKDDAADDEKLDDDAAEEALAAAALMDLATESDIEELAASTEDMQNVSEMMGVAMERTIVRLDRKARMKHLSKQAEIEAAKRGNDPNYKKLMKIWMLERTLEKKIHQRWGNVGRKIASKKIREYSANGKRIAKPNPSTVAFKGKVSGKVATAAVAKSKQMFSKDHKVTAEDGKVKKNVTAAPKKK